MKDFRARFAFLERRQLLKEFVRIAFFCGSIVIILDSHLSDCGSSVDIDSLERKKLKYCSPLEC